LENSPMFDAVHRNSSYNPLPVDSPTEPSGLAVKS
jgi:hypothetical protein